MVETNRIENSVGVPNILEYYGKECFYFSDDFLRMMFLSEHPVHDIDQVTNQVKSLLSVMDKEHIDLVELTIPDKPTSSKQKYRLTRKGITYKTKNQKL